MQLSGNNYDNLMMYVASDDHEEPTVDETDLEFNLSS